MNCFSDEVGPRALSDMADESTARPFELDEIARAADVLAPDFGMPRSLARVGLAYDMRPGALTPSEDDLAAAFAIPFGVVVVGRVVWETMEDAERADIVARAARIVRAERVAACRG